MPNSKSPPIGGTTGSTDQPQFGTEMLRQDAEAALDEAKDALNKVTDEVTSGAGELADRAKEQFGEAAEKAKGIASEQKDLLAAQIGGVADAMKRAADDLEAENGASAGYARSIADNAERLSSMIRDNDVDRLLEIAQDFGRRQPAAFLGGAALLGFAASRFLMASASRPAQSEGIEGSEDASYEPAAPGQSRNARSNATAGGM